MDNHWVVPYNSYLTTKYNCHINVKICSSITAIKYLFKYVYKGHDRATIEISEDGNTQNQNQTSNNNNEISLYLDIHYISISEAT